MDDVPAGIADLVKRFYFLLDQVVLWLVAECTLPGVFADGHATFFGPLFHLVILFLRDPGVQVQGAPGQIFRPFLLFLRNPLPFKSMRACERSGAIVGQAASRIVRHWYFLHNITGAVRSRYESQFATSLPFLHVLFS